MESVLSAAEILDLFRKCGALLEGHFLLTSGLHSPQYLQCALVLQYPRHAEQLCRQLAEGLKTTKPEIVIAPAIGGILVAHEVARALHARALFTERQEGKMTLRRGLHIAPGERALVVEDVWTTGGSTREVMEVVREAKGIVVGVGALVDRSGGRVDFGVRRHALVTLEVPAYPPEACPLCRQGLAAVKPGSRAAPAPG